MLSNVKDKAMRDDKKVITLLKMKTGPYFLCSIYIFYIYIYCAVFYIAIYIALNFNYFTFHNKKYKFFI